MVTSDAPINPAEAMEKARAAEAQGNWIEALRLWGVVYEREPHRPAAILGLVQSLVALGRLEEADMALDEGVRRFPNNVRIAVDHAELALSRGESELAAQRWHGVRSRFSDRPNILAQAGAAFSGMGRFDEAEALLAEATASFPRNEKIAVAYATSAQKRGDAAEALKRWQAVLDQFPDHNEAQAGIDLAQRELTTIEEARRLVALSQPAPASTQSENVSGNAKEPAASGEPVSPPNAATLVARAAQRMMAVDNKGDDGQSAPASLPPPAFHRTARAGVAQDGFVQRMQRAIRNVLGRA